MVCLIHVISSNKKRYIDPCSPNASNEHIHIGDVILEVNGESVVSATLAELQDLLRECDDPVPVVVTPGKVFDSMLREVTITRGADGFGLGLDFEIAEAADGWGADTPFPRVFKLLPGGAAAQTGQIHVGDHVLVCNGHSTAALAHDDMMGLLTSATTLELVLQTDHSPLQPELAPSARGRQDAHTAHVTTMVPLTPIMVAEAAGDGRGGCVPAGGVCEGVTVATGCVRAGEMILEINGQNVEFASLADVQALLKNETSYTMQLRPVAARHKMVTLVKSEIGFGLKLFADLDGLHELRISEVIDGGPAQLSGKVRVGDILVSINRTDTAHLGHHAAITMLVKNQEVDLVLEGSTAALPTENPTHRGICLHRVDGKLPISLEPYSDRGGAVVATIDADCDLVFENLIHVGDVVMQINGFEVVTSSWDRISEILDSDNPSDGVIITVASDRPRLSVTDSDKISQGGALNPSPTPSPVSLGSGDGVEPVTLHASPRKTTV